MSTRGISWLFSLLGIKINQGLIQLKNDHKKAEPVKHNFDCII